jgi:glycogen debranching enzyme
LASTQATEDLPAQDAEPGKILHELRKGEMVALGEVPFQKYYGSVDATPLFLVLASAYYERTGDLAFLQRIWEQLESALAWMDRYGDVDGDGFIEYQRRSSNGLENQGWKDSHDSISHQDGTLAEGPIALCEIQGYAFSAKMGMANLYDARGDFDQATRLRTEATRLQQQFQKAFWCEDLGIYALALDGKKRPCRVRTSNAGHCLYSGIASEEHASVLAKTLMSESLFTGWGIRTLADCEVRYNPMGYHNGSVWPHDTAMIAEGLSRYGYREEALKIFTGMFGVSRFVDLQRLPELFCGFGRRKGESPTSYPVACSPQAWAAGSVFMLLKACLGFSIHAQESEIRFKYPILPKYLSTLHFEDLEVGDSRIDLVIQRHSDDVGINVVKRTGNVEVLSLK